MVTDSQKARRVEWERENEEYSTTLFNDLYCEVMTADGVRYVTISRDGVDVFEKSFPEDEKSQRQTEIFAEVQLKNLVPRSVLSKFNPPERRSDV